MSKTPEGNMSSKKRLGLLKPEINLKRHPSVKSLFPDMDETSQYSEITNSTNEINRNHCSSSKNSSFSFKKITIISCDYKLSNENDTFFIEANDENENCNDNYKYNFYIDDDNIDDNNNFNKINKMSKPLFYGFTEEQKQLDKKITGEIKKGNNYLSIEKSFKGLLKK